LSKDKISSFLICSLPKKYDFKGVSIPNFETNFPARLVSSQKIKSTSERVSTTRFEISSKFPIGVGQM